METQFDYNNQLIEVDHTSPIRNPWNPAYPTIYLKYSGSSIFDLSTFLTDILTETMLSENNTEIIDSYRNRNPIASKSILYCISGNMNYAKLPQWSSNPSKIWMIYDDEILVTDGNKIYFKNGSDPWKSVPSMKSIDNLVQSIINGTAGLIAGEMVPMMCAYGSIPTGHIIANGQTIDYSATENASLITATNINETFPTSSNVTDQAPTARGFYRTSNNWSSQTTATRATPSNSGNYYAIPDLRGLIPYGAPYHSSIAVVITVGITSITVTRPYPNCVIIGKSLLGFPKYDWSNDHSGNYTADHDEWIRFYTYSGGGIVAAELKIDNLTIEKTSHQGAENEFLPVMNLDTLAYTFSGSGMRAASIAECGPVSRQGFVTITPTIRR